MFRLIFILFFTISCQSQKPKNTRTVRAKELNEYSYVVNSWFINDGKIINFPDENIFLNDYLNASSKDRPPKFLVYYFEDQEMKFAYKLKIVLDKTTSPLTTLSYLKSDELGCNKVQFSNEDFRRQSCYVTSDKVKVENQRYDISRMRDKVIKTIELSE